jgi:hypothetical protein
VRTTPLTWVTRVLWFALPFTLGELLADAVAFRSGPVRLLAAVLAWGLWVAGLGASLVPLPVTLTMLRVLAPLPFAAGVVAAVLSSPDTLGSVGLALAAAVAVTSMAAEVGDWFINGSAYGDERRMPLRAPTALLLGPVEVVWALTTGPLVIGLFLLAARVWMWGALLAAVGLVTAVLGFRTLSRLARRWIVFVPAGITIVDDLALAEPILLPRARIVRLGPAPADTDARDLSTNAAGLIMQVDLDGPLELVPAVRRGGVAEPVEVTSVLVAPGRPGVMLAHAEERRIAVSRA